MGFMDKLEAKIRSAGKPQSGAPVAAPVQAMPIQPAPVGPRFNASQFKQNLKVGKTRAQVQQNKAKNTAHKTRQAVIAELRANKTPTACIKMEQYLRDMAQIETHDVVEAYVELLVARVNLIDSTPQFDDLPDDVKEAIASLVFATARTSNTELKNATDQLRAMYTPNIVDPLTSASGPYAHHVNNVLARRMDSTPDDYVLLEGLKQVAAEENINWVAPPDTHQLRKVTSGATSTRNDMGGFSSAQGSAPISIVGSPGMAGFGVAGAGVGGMPSTQPSDTDMPSTQPTDDDYGSGWGSGNQ